VSLAQRFGCNLATHRQRVGVSQEELSFRAALHRTEIGLLERGERVPRIDTLMKLAGALGVNSAALLDGLEWTPAELTAGSFHFGGEGGP